MIESVLPAIRQVLADNRPLVLTADPGAGKTTVVPLALLREPWLKDQKILVLEPRRVAARAAASRMAWSLGETPGQTVGWRMARDTKVGPSTRLEVITEGILTRMLQDDPALTGVGLVLFDEFHERTLPSDLGLALTLDARQHLRPDLRLGLLSATLDIDAVCTVVSDAQAIHAPGRTYPVNTVYRPSEADLVAATVRAVTDGWDAVSGGLLVFLPGWAEIRRVAEALADAARHRDETILVLHGSLSGEDQAAVLEPLAGNRRKTILATSVAETSLTIPDIELVIDPGLARLNRFDQSRGLDRLVTERVSQASADQRRGRAGRTKPGQCWRLWAPSERLEPQGEPEIRRADLSSLVLECALWGVVDPDGLTWMTPPPPSGWNRARQLLHDLGALDGEVTAEGRRIAGLGVGPRLGVLLLRSQDERGLAAACAALLQDRDPLPTLRDPDLSLRLEPLLGGAQGPLWSPLRATALDLLRRLDPSARGLPGKLPAGDVVGRVVAPGFPDRVAQRREVTGDAAVFQIPGGRMLRARGALAANPWLVILDADAGETTGWVSLAVPLGEGDALIVLGPQTTTSVEVAWDGWRPRVFRLRRAGALLLERTGLSVADAQEEVREDLGKRLESVDPETLPWNGSSRQLVHRLALLDHSGPADWAWLADFADLSGGPVFTESLLRQALEAGLPWSVKTRLDQEVPETLVVPSGSRRRLEYREGTVVLEVRIQEVFGLAQSPLVAGRPVVLHLLSPAQRPLQVTSDLASFWKNTYPEVRKEMRGRYPRHYWPENPLEAEPTARAKPRGRTEP